MKLFENSEKLKLKMDFNVPKRTIKAFYYAPNDIKY